MADLLVVMREHFYPSASRDTRHDSVHALDRPRRIKEQDLPELFRHLVHQANSMLYNVSQDENTVAVLCSRMRSWIKGIRSLRIGLTTG